LDQEDLLTTEGMGNTREVNFLDLAAGLRARVISRPVELSATDGRMRLSICEFG
jgi:hypothetical protein